MAVPPKMMIMLPLMYFARKLDHNDPDLVYKLRCAYFTIQALVMSLIAFLYTQAIAFQKSKDGQKKVFVTKPAEPFSDPNAKKKYTEVVFGEHVLSTIQSLAGSTLFGVCVQAGLHWYNGMIAGFASQLIMGPLNILDNAATKFFIFGSKDAFETKAKDDLTSDDVIVDEDGKPVSSVKNKTKSVKKEVKKLTPKIEDVMLDAWDEGAKADGKLFLKALTKDNVNFREKENGWTPIMIMAGLGIKDIEIYLKGMKELGADPSIVDGEGWNALHWAAFHGCPDAAVYILSSDGFDGYSIGLHTVKDKDGKTPLEHSITEKNSYVSDIIKGYMAENEKTESKSSDSTGLRKRK